MVIWLIGISGAGKTTLGQKIDQYYKQKGVDSYLIDGDLIRDFFDNDLGFDKSDRIANIKRILLSTHILEQNGIIPIVCNISPFEELREFAREKLIDYNEIYLFKDIKVAQNNDVKDVYKNNLSQTSIVGIDMVFEEPKKSNLTINVDNEDVQTSYNKIINYFESKNNENNV